MLDTSRPFPSVNAVDEFILRLPKDYRAFGDFVRSTGANPEVLLSLTVPQLEEMWRTKGVVGAMEQFAQIPVDPDVPHMLFLYIRGWREKYIKRNKLQESDRPLQAFLDNKARPITLAMAEKAFLRTSRRLGVPTPITPSTIRDVVINEHNWSIPAEMENLDIAGSPE